MGTIINGINGGFRGKTGAVIGSSWKSINYIKGLYKKSNKPYTEAQLIVQERFKIMMRFLLPINNFLKIGFGQKKTNRFTPINYAFQFNQDLAIQGIHPNLTLDYSKIRIADGLYYGGGTVAANFAGGEITVTWSTDNNEVYDTKNDDLVYIVCYHPVLDEFLTSATVPTRQLGTVTFGVPEHLLGESVHIWYFMSDRTKVKVSRSSYLGEITLT
ncbi:DUF6266 family protein [Sphingobacterium sp. DR205]|uniref:DUF6266 family protein n=1 Tax=Sphingobacterium sp. DR205 TaxID=2713573 RepID=UPI0013E41594|nr:DUF6266 family protein [Sphingobacterium sp. DR205]QIH35490.1 hypothetical protein G6053_22580 [Sphingobacterium sp. DR205]